MDEYIECELLIHRLDNLLLALTVSSYKFVLILFKQNLTEILTRNLLRLKIKPNKCIILCHKRKKPTLYRI